MMLMALILKVKHKAEGVKGGGNTEPKSLLPTLTLSYVQYLNLEQFGGVQVTLCRIFS